MCGKIKIEYTGDPAIKVGSIRAHPQFEPRKQSMGATNNTAVPLPLRRLQEDIREQLLQQPYCPRFPVQSRLRHSQTHIKDS